MTGFALNKDAKQPLLFSLAIFVSADTRMVIGLREYVLVEIDIKSGKLYYFHINLKFPSGSCIVVVEKISSHRWE